MNYRLAERLKAYKANKVSSYPYRPTIHKFGTELVGRGTGWKDRKKRYTDSPDYYGSVVLKSTDRGLPNWCEGGWYADTFQYDVIEYGVARVRTPKGCLYVAVTWHTECDGATYHFDDSALVWKCRSESEHEQVIRDTLWQANRRANLEAEECRDHDAKFQAEQAIEYAREEIQNLRDSTRELIQERRSLKGKVDTAPAICENIRNTVSRNLSRIAKLREDIARWSDDYWSAVPNW